MNFRSITVTAPGKIILHGEHAVVYGKKAVASAIGLRTTLKLESKNDDLVTLNLLNFKTTCKWNTDELQRDVKKLGGTDLSCCTLEGRKLFNKFVDHCEVTEVDKRLIKAAISVFVFLAGRILEEFESLPSFSVEVITSIPIGAGLGSSAAYCVCLCTALLAATGQIPLPTVTSASPTALSASESERNVSLSAQDLELICKWSLEAEKLVHGKPSGIDNSVCTYGGVLTFQDGIIKHLIRIPQLQILVTHTKIPRSTKDLVSGLRERYNQLPTVYNPLFDAIGAIAEESCVYLDKLYQTQAEPENTEQNFQEHYCILEKLIDLNQQLLVTLGVSHSSLDQLCCVTAKHSMHSKLTGAGGGGCAFTLVTPDTSEESVTEASRELSSLGFEVWDTCLGDHGVTLAFT
ncbi:hypothetical protein OS493_004033 [Desmophyllum pertusum]|uniref:Mevalonate kinase n=1 Tax=Desmophyllum pertusum TaxID=174260 RepID=A0A9W9ZW31_9CNID|nr:hypothetical protein OS493_004033 [Desmophyllum pertusum]